MKVIVNDRAVELRDGTTVGEMLETLGIVSQRVAVEVNLEIIPRQEYGSRVLCEGDRVELITFVGGG